MDDATILAACQAISRAKRNDARFRHAGAGAVEKRASRDLEVARSQTADAATAWQNQIDAQFDPVMGTMLARLWIDAHAATVRAEANRIDATRVRETHARTWRVEDARCRSIAILEDDHRRETASLQDEAQLAALADRTTYCWMNR